MRTTPPERRYDVVWDEPGAGSIVDLRSGEPVIVFNLATDWTEDHWYPEVNPAGLRAIHDIIDTADFSRVDLAESEVQRLRGAIKGALDDFERGRELDAAWTLTNALGKSAS